MKSKNIEQSIWNNMNKTDKAVTASEAPEVSQNKWSAQFVNGRWAEVNEVTGEVVYFCDLRLR